MPLMEKRLKKKMLENPFNRRVFSMGADAYIVGGYLRDLICRGETGKDIDYVLNKDIKRITNILSTELDATVVELRKENIIRLVLQSGDTLDFSLLKKPIEDDLKERDFTIDAIAWSPETGFIDPEDGIGDIGRRIIRGISKENFHNDPIRLLRAYRLKAELGWPIHEKTRKTIRRMHSELRRPASERITLEFFRILCSDKPQKSLIHALEDGILREIIPLSFNNLEKNIKRFSKLDGILKKVPERYLIKNCSQGLSYKGLLRLEALLLGSRENLLCLSRENLKRVSIALELHKDYLNINRLSKEKMFMLFRESRDVSLDLLILSGRVGYLGELQRYWRITNKPILRGEDVIEATGVKTGPGIGEIMERINIERFEGKIKSRASAMKFLARTGNKGFSII
jgi:tRNA nucleotidyltransferase/poly(A) polymerase